jgi:NADH:ubiquinone reductase (H+-translocating)
VAITPRAGEEVTLKLPGTDHRVVIVGAGFGGLFAARFLRRATLEVTIIDRTNHHLFQPLLYQVATGILPSGAIAPATREVLRRHKNIAVEMGEVTGFDLDAKRLTATRPDGRAVVHEYDSLIVGAGAGGSYFGHDEFAEFAPGMKTLEDALDQRNRIFGALEMAELEQDPAIRAEWLTFAVVGGGPTGVEIAGQIAEMSRRSLKGNFQNFSGKDVRVLLFDGGTEILATFGNKLSAIGRKELEATGVEVHTESVVTYLDASHLEVKGANGSVERYAARTKIWAAGVAASPLARKLADASGAECDHNGRIKVQPDCSLPGYPEVFAVGDMMNFDDLPGVAEVAMQSGIHAARTIAKRVSNAAEPQPFTYRDLGSMAAISRRRAIVSFRGRRFTGWIGWLMWLFIHLTFMTGFRGRFAAAAGWFFSFVGHQRGQRALTVTRIDDRE